MFHALSHETVVIPRNPTDRDDVLNKQNLATKIKETLKIMHERKKANFLNCDKGK